MKSRQILESSVRCLLPVAVALIASATPASAQWWSDQLRWDVDPSTGGGQDGSGTWNATSNNWFQQDGFATTGVGRNIAWDASFNDGSYTAVFGSEGATASRTVTVNGAFLLANLYFYPTPNYTLSGGSIEIVEGGSIELDNASQANSMVTLSTVLKGKNITIKTMGTNVEQYLELRGSNEWTGKLTITADGLNGRTFIRATKADTLNTLSSIEVGNDSTLTLQGTNSVYTPDITIAGRGDGNRGALRMDQSMTLSGRITLSGDASISTQDSAHNGSTVTLTSGIGETGGSRNLTKSGTGNLIITGESNYTGRTIIGPTGTTAPGTLTLDFSKSTTTTDLLYNGVTANRLDLLATNGTATLSVIGKDGITNSQKFSGVEVTDTGFINATSGAGGTLNLNLGAITRGTRGSVLTITPQANGTITASGTGVLPWVTYVGSAHTGWATVNGGTLGLLTGDLTYASGTVISAIPGYTTASNLEISAASTGHVLQGSGVTQLSSITMSDAAAARTISVGTGNTLQFGANGGIQVGSVGKQLTVGSAPNDGAVAGSGELFFASHSAESLLINSVVADSGGALNVTVNGNGRVVLAGDNTYSGDTAIGDGVLEIRASSALGSTVGATTVERGGTLELAGNLNVAEDITLSTGILRNKSGNTNYTGTITLAGSSRINSDAGYLALAGTGPTNNVISGSGSLSFGGAGTTDVQGRIAIGGGSITKDGSGTLILRQANTYSGTTTLNGGMLVISDPNALGSATTTTTTGTVIGSGTLALSGGITTAPELLTINAANFIGSLRNLSGNNTYTGRITLGGNTRIHADAGTTLTLDVASGNAITSSSNTDRTIAFGSSGDVIVKDPIAHTGTGTLIILKDGIGTATLQANNSLSSGSIQAHSGKLVLDYSSSAAVLGTSQAITFGGGTLEVKGGAANRNPQLGNLGLSAYTGISTLVVGSNTTLTVGDTWNRSSASMLLIDISAPGSSLKSNPVSGEGGLLLATGGSNASFIVKDPSGYDFAAVKSGSIARLGATTELPTSGGSTTSSYVWNADGNTIGLSGSVSASTVRVDTSANEGVLDLAGKTLTLQRLGILVDGSNDFTITDSTGGGVLRGGSTSAVFLFHYGTGKVTVDAPMSHNGNSGQVFLVGTGLIDWKSAANASGNNYIKGVTARVSNGAIDLTNTTSGNGTGPIMLTQGGILELADGDLTRDVGSGNGRILFDSGSSAGDGGGFSAYGADRIVNLHGGATMSWGSTTGFLRQSRKLILGSPHANAVVDFQNNINLNNGIQTVDVQSVNQVGIGGKISGNIFGETGGLTKIGQGILTLSGTNTYGGTTSIVEGTLDVTGSINGTSLLTVAGGATLKTRGTGSVIADSFSLLDGSEISLELGAYTATTLTAREGFSLEGNIKLSLQLTTDPNDGALFTLLDGSDLLTGYGSGARLVANSIALNEGDSFLLSSNGFEQWFQISYLGGGGADITLLALPEPSTGAALLSSVGLLLGLNRFRRRSARQVLRP